MSVDDLQNASSLVVAGKERFVPRKPNVLSWKSVSPTKGYSSSAVFMSTNTFASKDGTEMKALSPRRTYTYPKMSVSLSKGMTLPYRTVCSARLYKLAPLPPRILMYV